MKIERLHSKPKYISFAIFETYMMKSSELIDKLFSFYRYKMKDSTIGKNNYTNILGKRSIFFTLSTTHTIQCTDKNYYIVYHYENFSHKI